MKNQKMKCVHAKEDKAKISNKAYSFCRQCGSTLFKLSNDHIISTVKPLSYQSKLNVDPKDIYSQLILGEFNTTPLSSWYEKHRKDAVSLLQKYSQIYKYSEKIYYLALTYIDIIMRNMQNLNKKKFELYIINCLLLAAKFKENDISEPNVSRFTSIGNYYDIDEVDINISEIEVLKLLNYNLSHLSYYEALNFFLNNGFVYEAEVENKSKEYINIIYCYVKKIFSDLINSEQMLVFNPIQIAFTVLHLARKQFELKNNYFNLVKKYYNYHLADYKDCLNVVKGKNEEQNKKKEECESQHLEQCECSVKEEKPKNWQSSRTVSLKFKSTKEAEPSNPNLNIAKNNTGSPHMVEQNVLKGSIIHIVCEEKNEEDPQVKIEEKEQNKNSNEIIGSQCQNDSEGVAGDEGEDSPKKANSSRFLRFTSRLKKVIGSEIFQIKAAKTNCASGFQKAKSSSFQRKRSKSLIINLVSFI